MHTVYRRIKIQTVCFRCICMFASIFMARNTACVSICFDVALDGRRLVVISFEFLICKISVTGAVPTYDLD